MMGASCATRMFGGSGTFGSGRRRAREAFWADLGLDPLEATEDQFRAKLQRAARADQGAAARSACAAAAWGTSTQTKVCGERGFIRCGSARICATRKFASSIARFAGANGSDSPARVFRFRLRGFGWAARRISAAASRLSAQREEMLSLRDADPAGDRRGTEQPFLSALPAGAARIARNNPNRESRGGISASDRLATAPTSMKIPA